LDKKVSSVHSSGFGNVPALTKRLKKLDANSNGELELAELKKQSN